MSVMNTCIELKQNLYKSQNIRIYITTTIRTSTEIKQIKLARNSESLTSYHSGNVLQNYKKDHSHAIEVDFMD